MARFLPGVCCNLIYAKGANSRLDEAARLEARRFRITPPVIVGALLVIASGLVFFQLFQYYWAQWNKDHSPFGFGYLVPPTIAFLLWCKRKSIAAEEVRPGGWWAMPVIVLAVGAEIVGMLAVFNLLQSLAFFILLMTVPYYLWGGSVYSRIWGPLAFTATMIPWPDQLTAMVLLPSQMLSTSMAAGILSLLGLRPAVDGTWIHLPTYGLEVAKACAGLTILFPVIAVTIFNLMIVRAALWRKFTVLLLAVPISMLSNAVRIAIIGVIGNSGGETLANSLHDTSGWFGVLLAIVLLAFVQKWLKCLKFYPEFVPKFARELEEEEPK